MADERKLLETIQEAYGGWNKARRRIADLILQDPARCSFLSLREFAALADTTDVTVINFCKGLGYSYSEFKKELQSYVLEWTNPSDRMKLIASSSDDAEGLYKKIYESEKMSVDEAFRLNSIADIMRANDIIRQSGRIFIASHNASRLAAGYLKYRFALLGVDMLMLDLADEHQSISLLKTAGGKDGLLISIATTPYGKPTIAMTRLARQLGMHVIAFTDDHACQINKDSDVAFICPSLKSFGGLANSYVPYVALFDAIGFFYYFGHEGERDESSVDLLKAEYKAILESLT